MFLKIKRPLSLSLQLSLWYTSVSFLLLLLGSGWMYLQLVRAYDASEADFLLRKALTLKELARQQDLPILKWEIAGSYLDGRTRPRAGAAPSAPFALTLSRVLSPDGSIMIETDRMSEQIPMQSFPLEGPLNGTYRGRLFRMLAMTSAEGFRIQVARDYTLQENIVASYRRKLWSFLGIGLLLSAQAGFMIARHGMRPVEGIAGTLQRIGSSTLGERVKTEGLPAELSLLASTFNKTLDRLEDAFARMASFSSDIAHELRTPIGNLRGESEVALSRARTVEEYRDILESSLEEYLRLSQIIDRLLFLARAENPATEIHREPVDVGMELQKVCEFYEAAASDASIGLDIVTPPSFIVGVDRTLLQRALSNLIENSRKVLKTQADQGSSIKSFAHDLAALSAQLKSSDGDLRRVIGNATPAAKSRIAGWRCTGVR